MIAKRARLTVLHWNIHSWRDDVGASNVERVAAAITGTDADLVSLVEVDESWSGPSTVAAIADRCGYAWVSVPSFSFGGKNGDDGAAGGYGNAILTRRPVRAVQWREVTWPPRPYDGTEKSEARTLLLVRIGLDADGGPGGTVWVGGTHLPRGDAEERARALDRVCAYASNLDPPWIVAGDFNTPPGDRTAVAVLRPGVPTYPRDRPVEEIDYFLASPGVTGTTRVLPLDGSDHLPVLLDAVVAVGSRPAG